MVTVQDIFTEYGDLFKAQHKISRPQLKAFKHIADCRTEKLGFHVDTCDECGYERILYNSCKDRHCPKCQTFQKEVWINNRKAEVIGTKYFHVVFTLPQELALITLQNQNVIFDIMFKTAAMTMKELCADKKYLGACPGFISVLHTWGQTMEYHPHIHMIVTGGGLTNFNSWIENSGGKKFFIPVKVLSKVFRGKFMDFLKKAYKNAELYFYGSIAKHKDKSNFQELIDRLFSKSWYSYVKRPFNGPSAVIEYLGRYTHRVCISNNRLLKVENNRVFFRYKDYKDKNNVGSKVISLEVSEFIRRFLLHVLPPGYVKIRYYGVLANINKKTKLVLCQRLTSTLNNPMYTKLTKLELLQKITYGKAFFCPACQGNSLRRLGGWKLKDTS